MKLCIGLIGAKGAGKTSAFEAISEEDTSVGEVTLAKKLKDVCATVSGVPRGHFDSHQFKESELGSPLFLNSNIVTDIYASYDLTIDYDTHIRPHIGKILYTPRQIAQYVGTEVLRAVESDIHCRVAAESTKTPIGVITDIRFPDEFEYFKGHAKRFIPIYIKNTQAELTASGDTHASEQHLTALAKMSPYSIENQRRKPLKDFQNKVKMLYREIKGEL